MLRFLLLIPSRSEGGVREGGREEYPEVGPGEVGQGNR